MHLILLWALVAIIGRVHCKCSLIPIVDDERSIAYACTHAGLNDLEEISDEAEWIEFTVSRLHHIPGNAFWRFNNLRRLSFYSCHIRFIDPDAFAGLDRLEWLIFHGTEIHVARTAWFRPLLNLRKLLMDKCGLVHIEPDVFRQLPKIETLGLRDNDLSCLPIKELSYLRELRTVHFDGNPWLCECRRRLNEYLKGRSIVQEARCFTGTSVCQCMALIGFPELPFSFSPQLTTNSDKNRTTIHGNELQTNVLTSLDKLPDETTWIQISGLAIDKLPRYAFFRFGNSLRSLDFNYCGIETIDDDAFAGLNRLQRLSMVGNRLAIIGANWFRYLFSLQQLILKENGIEQFERNSLSRVGDSLRYLDIRNNRLRCIDVEELAELKKLEKLDAVGNPWLCSCRNDLKNYLTRSIVGFEINEGRCYNNNENEIPDVSSGRSVQQTTVNENTVTSGEIYWTSFRQTVNQSTVNVTLTRPTTYIGGCSPDKTDRSSYTCRAITSIEELSVVPSTVHTIRVVQSNIKKIPVYAFSRFNEYLSALELRDCNIENIEARAFSNLHRLEYLSLRGNKLEFIDAEMFQDLYNLKWLDLSRNNVYRIANDAFNYLPHLVSLDISENVMNCIGIEYMAARLRHLASLRVSNNPWSCMCANKIAELLNGRGIRYDNHSLLSKEDCYFTQIPNTTVNPPTTTVVHSINNETIKGSCVPREDNRGLVYVCDNGNLLLLQSIPAEVASIVFQNCTLPRLPTEVFSRFTNLRELVIRKCNLMTVEEGAFRGLGKLTNLTIQDNQLEMIGSSWFVFENLERLDLRGNSIDYIEPGAFRHLSRLSYLNLEGNALRCIYTSELNDMPNVYVVEFFGNPLKWRCRVELEQFLEARKIRFVKIQNSCEGLKLMRSLLLQNKTDGSYDCPSDCSSATTTRIGQHFLHLLVSSFFLTLIP